MEREGAGKEGSIWHSLENLAVTAREVSLQLANASEEFAHQTEKSTEDAHNWSGNLAIAGTEPAGTDPGIMATGDQRDTTMTPPTDDLHDSTRSGPSRLSRFRFLLESMSLLLVAAYFFLRKPGRNAAEDARSRSENLRNAGVEPAAAPRLTATIDKRATAVTSPTANRRQTGRWDTSRLPRYLFLFASLSLLTTAAYFFVLRPEGNTAVLAVVATPTPAPTEAQVPPTSTPVPIVAPTHAPPTPSPTPDPGIDIARIVVPGLGINAPVIVKGVDDQGVMEVPYNPTDVAWYSFSSRPGGGGNVVLAGHVDYINYGPAVFYYLKDAEPGDEIHLELVDGTTATYRVLDVTSYLEATAPVQEIVGPTDTEIVTMITCGGSFDPNSRDYDSRVVVRAERIEPSVSTP